MQLKAECKITRLTVGISFLESQVNLFMFFLSVLLHARDEY